jgi:hypothetical protein
MPYLESKNKILHEDRTSGLWKRENEEKMRDDLHIPQFFITFVG